MFGFKRRKLRRAPYIAFGLLVLFTLNVIYSSNFKETEAERVAKHKTRTFIDVESWSRDPTVGCDGNLRCYGQEFARLQHARLNPNTQTFSIPCDSGAIPEYKFQYGSEGTPLEEFYKDLAIFPLSDTSKRERQTTTIVVKRIEAHNLYHTMCEWYNIFLLSKFFHFDPSKVDVLFMDQRPSNILDESWDVLVRDVLRYYSIGDNYDFKDLFWNIIGYESPMNHHNLNTLPFIREFRDFFIKSFNIKDTKTLICEQLTVTIILRRDYMTHPEREQLTGGLVHRKFQNEDEIVAEVKSVFDGATVNILILERMSMVEQLTNITQTDVLIGMHGAGLTHILFLPRHAAVFELVPEYFEYFHHFKAMARWRTLEYFGWQNKDPQNEFPDFYTRIPPRIIRLHCETMKNYLCGS